MNTNEHVQKVTSLNDKITKKQIKTKNKNFDNLMNDIHYNKISTNLENL